MKLFILSFVTSCVFSVYLGAQQSNINSTLLCEKDQHASTPKIAEEDLPKYIQAYNHILLDSINKNKEIFVSDIIVDMDRFYFKNQVAKDSTLVNIINSLTKYYWFDDFFSPEMKVLFGNQNKNTESILFFSLIEKNTLRADLFIKRHNIKDAEYNRVINSNRDKVYAYLFFFDKATGDIISMYREEMIYGI